MSDAGRDDYLEPRIPDRAPPLFDASGGWYGVGPRAEQLSAFSELDEDFGHPRPARDGSDLAFLDPHGFRFHNLGRVTPDGADDRRIAPQVWDDYDAEYTDARAKDAPYGQDEWISALNRSTRVADGSGRVAVHSSHRRLIDSEDDRYALALTMHEIGFGDAPAGVPQPDATDDVGGGLPPGVTMFEAGASAGSHGSVTHGQPGVTIGGVTVYGEAAQQAARKALERGGSTQDALRWALAAAQGTTFPPLLDADPAPRAEPPPPDVEPGGSVSPQDRPAGYVWTPGGVALLGTVFTVAGRAGSYFAGRDGTAIGPLCIRDDAQFSAGPEHTGRLHMRADEDAAEIEFAPGRRFKGWLQADSSLANVDTEVGLETVQWAVVLPVTAALPPEKPPPPIGVPGGVGGGPVSQPGGGPKGAGSGGAGGASGWGGRGGGGGGGGPEDDTTGGEPETPVRIGHDPVPGEDPAPEISLPGGQARNFDSPGVPCPNSTAGVVVGAPGGTDPLDNYSRPGIVVGGDGAVRDAHGFPAMTKTPGGYAVGGIEGLPFGLPPGRPRSGFDVGPPDDSPGRLPLGLGGGGGGGGGFDVEPGPDRGIPHRAEERAAEARRKAAREEREARRKAAEEAADKARQDEIDRLKGNEKYHDTAAADARAEGDGVGARRSERKARAAKRARERAEKRDQRIRERRQKREDYKRRKREEKERRREEKKKRAEKRKRERRERLRKAKEKAKALREEKKKGEPEGAWLIDTTPVGYGEPPIVVGDTSRFGDYNVANYPIPSFGGEDGLQTVEDWVHYSTHAMRAQQQILLGAFGGPRYLASNMAVRHENRPGNPPAASSIGSHWTAYPGEPIYGTPPAIEFVSILEAQPGSKITAGYVGGPLAGGGGSGENGDEGPESSWAPPFQFIREFRGGGTIEDDRPLVVLVNDRGARDGITVGPMIQGGGGRFEVDDDSGITGGSIKIYGYPAETGRALSIGGATPTSSSDQTPRPGDEWVYVDRSDGALGITTGLQLDNGALLTLYPEGTEATGVQVGYQADGTLSFAETSGLISPTYDFDGDISTTGDMFCSKLWADWVDPRGVEIDAVAARPSECVAGNRVIWVSSVDDKAYFWNGTTDVDLTAGGGTSAPTGALMPYAGGSSAPSGWLICDGQAVSRATYAALFAAIGTTYGSGDGSTTFNLPDLRAKVAGGVNHAGLPNGANGSYSTRNAADVAGAETHALTTAELAAHSHGVTDPGHSHTAENMDAGVSSSSGAFANGYVNGTTPTSTDTTGITVDSAGSGSAHNNMQPTLFLDWIVKT